MSSPRISRKFSLCVAALLLCLVVSTTAIAQKIVAVIPVGQDCTVLCVGTDFHLDINTATNRVFEGRGGMPPSGFVIDGRTNQISLGPVTEGTNALAVDSARNVVYITDDSSVGVFLFDGATGSQLGQMLQGPGNSTDVKVNTITNRVYLAVSGTGVLVGDPTNPSTVLATLPVPANSYPAAVALDQARNRVYVAVSITGRGSIEVFNGATDSLIATIPAGLAPSTMAVDSSISRLFGLDQFTTGPYMLRVVDTSRNTTVARIQLPGAPAGLAVDPVLHLAFVSIQNSSKILIVDGKTAKVAAHFSVKQAAGTMAFNALTGRLYVNNFGFVTVVQF